MAARTSTKKKKSTLPAAANEPVALTGLEPGTPYQNAERRTCLLLTEEDGVTTFTPLDITNGLTTETLPAPIFHRTYSLIEGYPRERACQLYLSYAQTIGASPEVLRHLKGVIPISDQEHEMATNRQVNKATDTKKRTPAATTAAGTPHKSVKEAKAEKAKAHQVAAKRGMAAKKAAKTAVKKAAPKRSADESATPRITAASRFKELIMEGKYTDDQIFAIVQREFDLDDSKRTYVKWYRNKMIKDGVKKVPAAK